MKSLSFLKIALLAFPLILGSCKSVKTVEKTAGTTVKTDAFDSKQFLQKVSANAPQATFITSKIKFRLQMGSQDISLSGNLKMKRDDVIRLQLVALGFIEAGRLEFTKDYVLVMDRINKQYIKVAYNDVDFLRNSGINFYSLQALFWNELFQPGKTRITSELFGNYNAYISGSDVAVMFERDKMTYRWMADETNGQIKSTNVLYKDPSNGNTQLNWRYEDFQPLGSKQFPTSNSVKLTTPKKEITMNITLNNIDNDSDWETRTEVSSKYKKVNLDDILRRLTAL